MTGRASSQILNGVQGRHVRAAIAELLATPIAEPAPVNHLACSGCGGAIRFEPEAMTGHVDEICDTCRTRRRVERRTAAQALAAEANPVMSTRQCERCGTPLGAIKRGRKGGRLPRLCKDRRACAKREMGLVEAPQVPREVSVRRQVLAVVPDTKARAVDSAALHALLPRGTDIGTVRVALYELWSTALVARERRGLSYFYWRTTDGG